MYSWLRADISAPPNYSSFQVKCLPPNFRQLRSQNITFDMFEKFTTIAIFDDFMGFGWERSNGRIPNAKIHEKFLAMQKYSTFGDCKTSRLINRNGSKFSLTITLNRSNWTTTAVRLDAHRLSFYRTLINAFKNCDWKKAQTFETLTQLPQVIFL